MSINRVSITGNLTRDPELRVTAGGTQVLSFGRRRERPPPQPADRRVGGLPQLHRLRALWSPRRGAEPSPDKGLKVAVEGRLRYNSYVKDDERHTYLDVVVGEVEFISPRRRHRRRPTARA